MPVKLDHERNRRQRKNCQHVEITARGRGPVVRAEACADSFYGAMESAVDKLAERLRRARDRRKIHYGDKTPVSVAKATAVTPQPEPAPAEHDGAALEEHEPGRIVRVKEHPATPMTVDDALYWQFNQAFIFIQSNDATTLPVGIGRMVIGDVFQWGPIMASSVTMAIPVVLFYAFAQRFLVEGLTAGSVKG